MSSFNFYLRPLLLLIISLSLLSSCKTLKSTLNGVKDSVAGVESDFSKITADIDKITNNVTPVDTLVYNAVSGALEGVTSEESKKNLETLTSELSKNITKYVNKALDSLDTATPAKKLVEGIKESLLAESTSDELKALLNKVLDSAGNDLDKIIEGALATISSQRTQRQLKSVGNAVVSGITDSLGIKINQAIEEVNFSVIGDSISHILSEKLEQRITEIAGKAAENVTEKGGEGAQSTIDFLKKNVIKVISTLGVIAAGLIYLVYRLRRKNKLVEVLAGEIENMKDNDAIKTLKRNIKSSTTEHKLEKNFSNYLKNKKLS